MSKSLLRSLILLTVLVDSFVVVQAQCQETPEDYFFNVRHQGKVKSITQVSYHAKERKGLVARGDRISKVEFDYSLLYNENGRIFESQEYLPASKKMLIYKMKYDKQGNIVEQKRRFGSSYELIKFKYDDKGNKIERAVYDSLGHLMEIRNLNSAGEVLKEIVYELNDSIRSYQYTKLDSKGNIIESVMHDSKHIFYSDIKCIYRYDDKGNKVERFYYDSNRPMYCSLFEYDNKGNMIQMASYSEDGICYQKQTYKYDDKNRVVEQAVDEIGHYRTVDKFKYDESGHKIYLKNELYFDGKLSANEELPINEKKTFVHEFDEKKNWIKETEFENKIPMIIRERKIEYFE